VRCENGPNSLTFVVSRFTTNTHHSPLTTHMTTISFFKAFHVTLVTKSRKQRW